MDREKRTAMSFGDVPGKTVFAAKVLGPAQGQDCMGQGLRKDAKFCPYKTLLKSAGTWLLTNQNEERQSPLSKKLTRFRGSL